MKNVLGIIFLMLLFSNSMAQTPVKIPLYSKNLWEGNDGNSGLYALIDGDTVTSVQDGWSKLLQTYDVYYEFDKAQNARVSNLRIFSLNGNATIPTVISYSTWDDPFNFKHLFDFVGASQAYNKWIDIPLPLPASVRYIKLTTTDHLPNELEAWGTYNTAYTPPVVGPVKHYPFANYFGANGQIWDMVGMYDASGNWNNQAPIPQKVSVYKDGIKTFRMYAGRYFFQTGDSSYVFGNDWRGWGFDSALITFKKLGIQVFFDIKEESDQMVASYPDSLKKKENAAVYYKDQPFKDSAFAYLNDAQTFFQTAARWGRTKVNPALLMTPDQVSGMNVLEILEVNNECNANWAYPYPLLRYQTPFQYAMNMSMVYDGNKGQYKNVGVKNADPTMKVIMGGISGMDYFYMRDFLRACEQIRGRNADGTVNYPFDGINYHLYQTTGNMPPYPDVYHARSASPETTGLLERQDSLEWLRQQFFPQTPIYQTETGYDLYPGALSTPDPIPGYSQEQTNAIYDMRTALLYSTTGIAALDFYQMTDVTWNSYIYATSGLVDSAWNPRLMYTHLKEMRSLLGSYTFQRWVSHSPNVLEYQDSSGHQRYVGWLPVSDSSFGVYKTPNLMTVYSTKDNGVVDTTHVSGSLKVTAKPVIFDMAASSPLPITLVSEQATCVSTGVEVKWVVAHEVNVLKYQLQRSSATSGWTTVAEMTPNGSDHYSLMDKTGGRNFYRIVEVDKDGSTTDFTVVSTNCEIRSSQLVLFPNPTHSDLSIRVQTGAAASYSIDVFDMQGKLVSHEMRNLTEGVNQFSKNVATLAAGIYIMVLRSSSDKQSSSFEKL